MKSKTVIFLSIVFMILAAACLCFAQTVTTPVNVGTTANDGTGDPLRSAFVKINSSVSNLNGGKLENTNGTSRNLFNINETNSGETIQGTNNFTGIVAHNTTTETNAAGGPLLFAPATTTSGDFPLLQGSGSGTLSDSGWTRFTLPISTVSNSVAKTREAHDSLKIPSYDNCTNVYLNGQDGTFRDITITALSCIASSTTGAFGPNSSGDSMTRGSQVEFADFQQIVIAKIIDNNHAIVYDVSQGTFTVPQTSETSSTAITNWHARTVNHNWSDDTIGGSFNGIYGNFGGFVDAGGQFWEEGINDNGAFAILNTSDGTITVFSMMPGSGPFGVSGNEEFSCIGASRTNASLINQFSPGGQIAVSSMAAGPVMLIRSNDVIDLGNGAQYNTYYVEGITNSFNNRFTTWVRLVAYQGLSIETNLPPASAFYNGETFFWNSNGVNTFVIKAHNNSTTWLSTNLLF